MSATPVRVPPVPAKIALARAPPRARKALLKPAARSPPTVPSTPNPNPTDPNPNPNPNPPSTVHFSATSLPPPPFALKRTYAFVAEDDGEESATDDDTDYVPVTPVHSPADAVTSTNPPPAVNPHSPIRAPDVRAEIADLRKQLNIMTVALARKEEQFDEQAAAILTATSNATSKLTCQVVGADARVSRLATQTRDEFVGVRKHVDEVMDKCLTEMLKVVQRIDMLELAVKRAETVLTKTEILAFNAESRAKRAEAVMDKLCAQLDEDLQKIATHINLQRDQLVLVSGRLDAVEAKNP